MKTETLETLQAARAGKRPVAVLTRLSDGDQVLVEPGDAAIPEGLADAVARAFDEDRSRTVADGEDEVFVHVFNPPHRLLVIGAVHIAEPLAGFAAPLGFAVTLIDPRRAFADRERFPGVAILDAWPDDAMAELRPDARTAIVTLTHDPKIDDPALHAALASEAFYVGSLGSTRTHAKRVVRLKEAGFDDAAIGRIHAPVGLDIGSKTPAEIALSIMAEIVAARRGAAA